MIISCQNCSTRMQLDTRRCRCAPSRCAARSFSTSSTAARAPRPTRERRGRGRRPALHERAQRDANSAPATDITLTPEETLRRRPSAGAPESPASRPCGGRAAARRIAWRGAGGRPAQAAPRGAPPSRVGTSARARLRRTPHRQEIARDLTREGYEVTQAGGTAQAIERMRGDKLDVLVLDNEFDMAEQGAAFLTREINSLRPSERRRLVVVHLSQSGRTEDAHAAFLANANLIVNTGEVAGVPRALERTVRDLNELYKDFNRRSATAL